MKLVQGDAEKKRMLSCPQDKKDIILFNIRGVKVAYDCNEMSLYHVGEGENSIGSEIGTSKPQVPLFCDTQCSYLVLNVVHSCNLACKYCFASVYNRTPKMSPDLARECISKLFHPRKNIKVGFFGGEPLMAWDTIVAAVEYAKFMAKARKVSCSFHVTTNATLITDEIAKYIADHNFSVLVSLDGTSDVHNEYRPMKNGQDSYKAVMQGMELLKKHGVSRVTIRSTFTPERIELLERAQHFQELVDAGYAKAYSIEPVCGSEGCSPLGNHSFSKEVLQEEFSKLSTWYLEHLNQGRILPYFYYRKLLEHLMLRKPQCTECGAGKGYLTVNPLGDILACHRESGTKIGHVRLGIDEELRLPWMENRIFRSKECMSCWARYICGGGCRQIKAEAGFDFSTPSAERCKVMEVLAMECLWLAASMPPETARNYGNLNKG